MEVRDVDCATLPSSLITPANVLSHRLDVASCFISRLDFPSLERGAAGGDDSAGSVGPRDLALP